LRMELKKKHQLIQVYERNNVTALL